MIPGNLRKHPANIMEKSWNFVIAEKWEPCECHTSLCVESHYSNKDHYGL